MNRLIALALLSSFITVQVVNGHGMMMNPPGRSSMYHYFPEAIPNYNEMSLNCGGVDVCSYPKLFTVKNNNLSFYFYMVKIQFNENGGMCGECGDNYALPRPRQNEEGGKYGKGIIGQTYKPGTPIQISIQLTANHLGYFEFRLCADKQSADELVTQQCLDKHLLQLADGSTRFHIQDPNQQYFNLMALLPQGVTCQYCVIQWHYLTGNSWGSGCADGSGVGCGDRQETFRNCADVAILP